MDWSREWAYFPIAVFVNTIFLFLVYKFYKKEPITIQRIIIWFLTSSMMGWGIDVVERHFEATKFEHMIKISFGCWFLFVLSSYLRRKIFVNNFWSTFKTDLKNDLLIDLISFELLGLIIFTLT